MPNRLRPRTPMSLGGLSLRQLAVGMWKRMEEHDAMTWAAAVAFYAMLATVPFLALVLVVVVLRLPDLSGAGRRTTGLGNLTVDQLDATLRSLFPNEAYVLVRDQIAHIQGEPPLALLSLGAGDRALECVEPVPGRHRRAESDLRGQGDAIVS